MNGERRKHDDPYKTEQLYWMTEEWKRCGGSH
jgi:hypothetical protein